MALSGKSIVALCATFGGAAVLAALAMSPAVAGGPPAVPFAGGCDATARVASEWGSGQIVSATVTNTTAAPITRWTVTWTLGADRRVVSAWNATVTTSGGTATAVNASWNGGLAAGASATFGLQLAGTGPAPQLTCDNGVPTASLSLPASSSTPSGPGVTVTTADNRGTVRLHVGDALVVSLPRDYGPPALSAAGVLAPGDVAGGYPTGQPLVARYTAAAAGTVTVSTRTDIACFHEPTPCPSPSIPWTLTAVVTA